MKNYDDPFLKEKITNYLKAKPGTGFYNTAVSDLNEIDPKIIHYLGLGAKTIEKLALDAQYKEINRIIEENLKPELERYQKIEAIVHGVKEKESNQNKLF